MSLLGVLSNRFSDGNGGRPLLAELAGAQPDVVFAAPTERAALPAVLRDFAERGIRTVAVDGGDGTIRDVLSAFPHGSGSFPTIALLPSGKTNLVAGDVGTFGSGPSGLHNLLASMRNGFAGANSTERHCLEVEWCDDPQRVVRGLFFGAGIFTHATRMAGQWAHDRGVKQRSAVALTMARTLYQTVRGHEAAAGTPMAVSADNDDPAAETPHFLVLATTLQRLMLGLWPFPHNGDGALHWLDVLAPPRRLDRALWAAWRGRMTACPQNGYDGGRAHTLAVQLRDPFVVDGEIFTPGNGGVSLRAGPAIRFISG